MELDERTDSYELKQEKILSVSSSSKCQTQHMRVKRQSYGQVSPSQAQNQPTVQGTMCLVLSQTL